MKTSGLTGAALDWAVAKARGLDVYHSAMLNGRIMHGFWVSGYYPGDLNSWVPLSKLASSTDWAQAGPIIEREKITLLWQPSSYGGERWFACIGDAMDDETLGQHHESDPLVAAMRAFVASKLGDGVEVPDGLI